MAAKGEKNPFQRFIDLLRPEKDLIVIIYIYGIFAGLISLTLPLGIQAIINFIMGGDVSTSWILLVVFVILGIIITGVLQVKQLSITETLQQKIFTKASFEFAYRIPRFNLNQVKDTYLPELINRFFDTVSVQKGLSKILLDFSTGALQILFGLILLSFYHPFFIIFSFLLVILIFMIIRFTGPKGLKTSMDESHYKYQTAHWLEELARNVETFKMATDSTLPLENNDRNTENYLKSRQSHFKVVVSQFSMMIAFKALVAAGLLLIGGILVFQQQMNIGQFVAAEIIIILVINSVEKLIGTIETIYDVLTAVEKIAVVTDIPLEEYLSGNKSVEPTGGINIRLNNLNLKDNGHIFLNNLNLDIKEGDKICISGPANSGKTILLQLLSGWYSDYEGNILINDLPLNDLDLTSLRRNIGDCMATEGIFQGSIEENIQIGSPFSSFKEIQEATKISGLSQYMESNHIGYQKILYPGDRTLPKRAKQQILWARGILGNKRLVLWEDTSGQLSHKEKIHFVNHLLAKDSNTTVLIVSNDLSILKKCERAIGMENGEVLHDIPAEEANKNQWFRNNCLLRDA
jgi:ABC-type bacteriocin/lantibiotic exporter with double-glycine peptidase domain